MRALVSQSMPDDPVRLLLVEDDEPLRRLLTDQLRERGYAVQSVADGRAAIAAIGDDPFDIVILDRMLPFVDGVDVLRWLREQEVMTPVILLTALGRLPDRVEGREAGADDYVVKPFNPLEVVARVKAVLRRSAGAGHDQSLIRFGALQLDTLSYTAAILNDTATIPLDLTLTEYRLLSHMLRAPRRVFDRAELVDACLPEGNALERTVDSHISNLRRKLDRAGMTGLCVVVRGVGYRLAAS